MTPLAKMIAIPALAAALQGCISDNRGTVTVCPVHHCDMPWETKIIGYGLPARGDPSDMVGRFKAEQSSFPYAHSKCRGGCMQGWGPVATMIRYCPQCRKAEAKWDAEHPVMKQQSTPTQVSDESK
jgi:hypothetical protein